MVRGSSGCCFRGVRLGIGIKSRGLLGSLGLVTACTGKVKFVRFALDTSCHVCG